MTARPFQVNPVLTAIVIGYRNPAVNLIADRVLPRMPAAEKFAWTLYGSNDFFTVPPTRVGRKGRVAQVEFTSTPQVGEVVDYGLEDGVPYSDITTAANLRAAGQMVVDPEVQASEGLTSLIELDREVRAAGAVFNASNYDQARQITLAGTSQFSDYANSDPVGVILAGLDACLIARPNKMVFGQTAWSKFRGHPRIVKAVKGGISGDGLVSKEQVAELFELDEIIVGASMVNTARKGQVANLQRVWGKHISLLYVNPKAGPGSSEPTFGFTADCGGKVAFTYEDRNIGLLGGRAIRVGERVKEVVAAPSTSYFIQNAIA